MNYKNVLLIALLCMTSCFTKAAIDEIQQGQSYVLKNKNILYSKLDSCMDVGANQTFNEYFGIKISSDYILKDSISLDLNTDKTPDRLLVLSPVVQEKHIVKSKCYHSKFNNRLLVMILSGPEGNKVEMINETAILNNNEFYDYPYKGLFKDTNGFNFRFFIGTSTKCYYDFYFKKNSNNQYYLSYSKYHCYLIDLSNGEKKETKYEYADTTRLDKIDIRKFFIIPQLRKNQN